jgi:hypothetical protein
MKAIGYISMIMKASSAAITSHGNCKSCDSFTAPHQYEAKLSPCLIKHHVMGTCGRFVIYKLGFLTSALEKGDESASRPGLFTLREIFHNIH